MTTITGRTAITVAETLGLTLSKYADPTEGARSGLSVAEARDIARQDARLIYVDSNEVAAAIEDEAIEALRSESAMAGDMEQVAICDGALLHGTVMCAAYRVECARVIADEKAQS